MNDELKLGGPVFSDSAHYENGKVESFDQVRQYLEGGADELNWVFVGTSGVHGFYRKLDEWPEEREFTILIVRPRLVSCVYGHVEIPSEEDLEWLQEQVEKTIEVIEETQSSNL